MSAEVSDERSAHRRDRTFFWGGFSRTKCVTLYCALWCIVVLAPAAAEVLTPPLFNLAERRPINATATCGQGVLGPELYCKIVGTNADINIAGQACDYCDATDKDKRHPPEYAVDGTESWWQSPPLSRDHTLNNVNLTIDLGQEFHVAYVVIKMANSPRPAVWILERSADQGKTYQPWQYFADSLSECEVLFGAETIQPITRDDSVICETEYSKILPVEGGEIVVSFLNKRPSANDFYNSPVLQEFTRATNVRLRFLRTKTFLGQLMSVARQDPTMMRRHFYSIKDISIGGRCVCNGHALNCDLTDPDNPSRRLCDCQHNTYGPNCDQCRKGYEQKKWKQNKHKDDKFECEPCNCFGHSTDCKYNETIDEMHLSLDIHGKYEGGGECINCRHNTEGINCHKCKSKFFRPYGRTLNATDVCEPCRCDEYFSTGECREGDGVCFCKKNYTMINDRCAICAHGFYEYPECKPCECSPSGTRGSQCLPTDGFCQCKQNYAGHLCDSCDIRFFGYPECTACSCDSVGSRSDVCDNTTGNCDCKSNFGGRNCSQCQDGFHSFPECRFCDCDTRGTEPGVCQKSDGSCLCKDGFGGPRCDMCTPGYYGFPHCRPCNCSAKGSPSSICDHSGKCSCLPNFSGRACDQCRPGFYRYPDCLLCGCHPRGADGVGCDDQGHCLCKKNFVGSKCETCEEGKYNFPLCEECSCNRAGVTGSFAGCGSLTSGELCECKSRVQGRSCDDCKPTYWNLQAYHKEGCEECDCHIPGVVGGINVCNTKSGQCMCKTFVESRKCDICKPGTYDLQESNIFGCTDCECDVGGSVKLACNRIDGQCTCRPRITGRTCNAPMRLHYFPTLYQHQYEAEDAVTVTGQAVRFDFNQSNFADYSWKGYVFFVPSQNEIFYTVTIPDFSVYKIVLRYVNKGDPILANVTVTPDGHSDPPQTRAVLLNSTTSTPRLITVPAQYVMYPGTWSVSVKAHGGQLLLDYFVLLPSQYYEGLILKKWGAKPCIKDEEWCQLYSYPKVTGCDTARGKNAFAAGADKSRSVSEFYNNNEHLSELGLPTLPMLSRTQSRLSLDLKLTEPGPHVLLLSYVTPHGVNYSTRVVVEVGDVDLPEIGIVTLPPCPYKTPCRQAIIDAHGRVSPFNLTTNSITLTLNTEGDANAAIDCIVAVPYEDWSLDYIQPKLVCLQKDGKCVVGHHATPPQSKKIQFGSSQSQNGYSVKPSTDADKSTELVLLDSAHPVEIQGTVPNLGLYVLIVHYHQPDNPGFSVDAVVRNGETFEGKLNIKHCPLKAGCRAVVQQPNGMHRSVLSEKFVLSLRQPDSQSRNGVWLDYLLIIPAEQYSEEMLEIPNIDLSQSFVTQCGQDNFYIDPKTKGFCKEAVFSITTAYNTKALPCECSFEGSTDLDCEFFGGQCPCKENVIGRQCSRCRPGYHGFPNCKPCKCPPNLTCNDEGKCECPDNVVGAQCDKCKENTYGFIPGFGCQSCDCEPRGVLHNNLQCDMDNGSCACKPNVVGLQCRDCLEGYYNFPHCIECGCDTRGTIPDICDQVTAACYCKSNVEGPGCDVCRDGTFDIQADNAEGCTKCFCFGKTTRCTTSALYRTKIMSMDDWLLKTIIYPSNPLIVTSMDSNPMVLEEGIGADFSEKIEEDEIVYFKAPKDYYGNMLFAYGGNLDYTIFYTSGSGGQVVFGPDIVLHGGNDIYLTHSANEIPSASTKFNGSVAIVERNFINSNGQKATREQLMQVLQKLYGIYIRATYWEPTITARLLEVSLDTATEQYNPTAGRAHAVEHCSCPQGYKGHSCEDCAPGYYRSLTGPYGGFCIPCQCNGHSETCDPVNGICTECEHNTYGEHCELCSLGYYGDATKGTAKDCHICACPLPQASNNFATSCVVSADGERYSCDCKEGYFGATCNTCAAGYYGRPEVEGDYCKKCMCNSNIDPSDFRSCDSVTGECMVCLNNTFGESCQYCAPGFYGDAIQRKDCQSCVCVECGTARCNNYTGNCECRPNVIGDKCEACAPDHYGYYNGCQGCSPCLCGIASESTQCDETSGQCRCKPGVTGATCEKCLPGYWNYSADGCISCGCNKEYSIGYGCNPANGQCECLPGVAGEKCDRCPYRWVLKINEGCFSCDTCTDGLLDVTDDLSNTIDPLAKDFETVAAGHFTRKRLNFIRNQSEELKPEVKKLIEDPVDIGPVTKLVEDLYRNSDEHMLQGRIKVQSAEESLPTSTLALNESLKLENLMAKAEDEISRIVMDVEALTFQDQSGSQKQLYLNTGQSILEQINLVDFTDYNEEVEKRMKNARILEEKIEEKVKPVNELTSRLKDHVKTLEKLNSDLADMEKISENITGQALQARGSYVENTATKIKAQIEAMKQHEENAKKYLANAKEILLNTSFLIPEADTNFKKTGKETIRLIGAKQSLNDSLNGPAMKVDHLRDIVEHAAIHTEKLNDQVRDLKAKYEPIARLSDPAMVAANSYVTIFNATDEATKVAHEAEETVNTASQKINGLAEKAEMSREKSLELLRKARPLKETAVDELHYKLNSATDNVTSVEKHSANANHSVLEIEKALKLLPSSSGNKTLYTAISSAESGEDLVKESAIGDMIKMLPEKSAIAKQVPTDVHAAKESAKIAEDHLNKAASMYTFSSKISNVKAKQENLNSSIGNARDHIEDVKRKVLEARETINRIKVGVQFSPSTTLELRNPESLTQQTTNTHISLYFKTAEPDGLVLYLGNEKDSHRKLRRTKTDDYMALIIENGFPVLSIDLGSGTQRVIVGKPVNDDKWYQAIIDRTGKSARLTIIEDGPDQISYQKEEVITGTHSILNLDPEYSKLFVGGYPTQFKIQDDIRRHMSFDGEMESLVVGNTSVSLWNFVDGANNQNGAARKNKSKSGGTTHTGYRFNGSGYAVLDSRSYIRRERTSIQFKFKTKAKNGLLYLIGGPNHFLSIELRDGRILYQFYLGDEIVTILSPDGLVFNDDKWHSVAASREYNIGLLKVDAEESPKAQSSGSTYYMEPVEEMYFGGYPGDHNYQQVTNIDFDGCIDDVLIESTVLGLSSSLKALGVSPGCPAKVIEMVSFNERNPGYAHWPFVKSDGKLQLNLRFKTESSPGLIAFVTNSDQSATLSLSMVNGILFLRSKNAEINTSPTEYNDGQWHVITATYEYNALQLDVDDFEMFKTTINEPPLIIEDGSAYFGGVPDNYNLGLGATATRQPFAGCLADVIIGGTLVNFANATDRKNVISNRCTTGSDSFDVPDPYDDDDTKGKQPSDSEENEITSQRATTPTTTTAATLPTPAPTPAGDCTIPYEPAGDPDVRAENGLRFGTTNQSFLQYHIDPGMLKQKFEFSLEFKTNEQSGVIFYAGHSTYVDHVALYLENGLLQYSFDCGSGRVVLASKPSKRLNDSEWHTVVFSRNQKTGQLNVDEVLEASGDLTGTTENMDVQAPAYLGKKLPNSKNWKNSTSNAGIPGFTGCIRSFKWNKAPVEPTNSIGVIPCSEKVEKGFFFGPAGGYIKPIDKFNVGKSISFTMEIKSRYVSGVLLAVHSPSDYMLLQMVNGTFKFTVDNGNGPVTAAYTPEKRQSVCDGRWIKIEAVKQKNVVSLLIDDEGTGFKYAQGGKEATNTKHPLYVGGIPNKNVRGLETTENFVGCIRNVYMDRGNKPIEVPLRASSAYGSVISKVCPTT